jgi:hypothetical protein
VAASPMTIRLMMTACWCACRPEVVLGHPFHEAARASGCGLLNVVEVIGQAVLAHIGCASASTLARNFGGRSPGVSRSTSSAEQRFQFFFQIAQVQQRGTGQRIDQQVDVAAIASVPCSTEPKTRGFAARKRPTASRTALRFMSSTTDGRMGILSYRNSLRCMESRIEFQELFFRESQCLDSRAALSFSKVTARNMALLQIVGGDKLIIPFC